MKVIDLLNKMANGEELPKKIKVYGDIFILDEGNNVYENELGNNLLNIYNGHIFKYEVEIIEDKKIEKIEIKDKSIKVKGTIFFRDKDIEIFQKLSLVINEIIDKLEENKND